MEEQFTEPVETKPAKPKKEHAAQVKEDLFDVSALADEKGLSPWDRAGMFRAAGWAAGKQVTRQDFEKVLDGFTARRQGGGRIQA